MTSKIENLSAEKKQQLKDRIKAREIVKTILDFGITNGENIEIIKLLALELEDRQMMLGVYEHLNEAIEEEQTVKIYT